MELVRTEVLGSS